MTFWSGEKILENRSVVEKFDSAQVDANAYNLKMGNCYFVTGSGEDRTKIYLQPGQPFIIPPGQFSYLMSSEELNIPENAMAFISMRTGIKFNGLINVSGFHVDPGYKGKLIYAVFNASPSPLQICEGDEIFKIWFADLDQKSGKENLFKGSGKVDIGNELIRGMSKEIYSLQSINDKLRALDAKVNTNFAQQKSTTDFLSTVWNSILTALTVGMAITVFTIVFPLLAGIGTEIKEYFLNPAEEIVNNATDKEKSETNN